MKRSILAAVALLFTGWVVGNFGRITGDQDGVIRFVLGTVLSLLILLRIRPITEENLHVPGWAVPCLVGVGTLMTVVGGIIFDVNQLEWLGIIVLLGGCLLWSLPEGLLRNILPSLLLLYWIHPLPGKVFGQFQLFMQKLSAKGAEWLLHCLNIRVWADDFILHNGFQAFGVPESCSGMRTSVTVLLCTLGVALLFRMRWYATLIFLVLGMVQVLLINVARIAGMVIWAPHMPKEWADHFLHDTLGIFLLVTIMVVQAEMSAWKLIAERRRKLKLGVARGHIERFAKGNPIPRVWRLLLQGGLLVLAVAMVLGALAFALYKHRPSHRSAMITAVAETFLETDPGMAASAIESALRLTPADRALQSLRINVMVRRGQHARALELFEKLPEPLAVNEIILKSWALMAVKREEEAISLVNGLSARDRELPGVAMVRSEYAARRERPEECARFVVKASPVRALIQRVRNLFPYLARHEQWNAIAACDSPVPFSDLPSALISIYANLQVDDVTAAGEVLKTTLAVWPNHPLCLNSLFTLALKRPGGPWEGLFAENLRANLNQFDADLLSAYVGYAFQLTRPDLAWLAYIRLRTLDATDPALFMNQARFANEWFVFRRQYVGVGASTTQEGISLAPFCLLSLGTPPFQEFWKTVPLASDLAGGGGDAVRHASMQQCLDELQKREAAGTLSLRMDMMYPIALAMLGRFDEAHTRLDAILKKNPKQQEEVLLQHALFYDQQGRWQDSYEALTKYGALRDRPPLTAELALINALMNLNLGLAAFEVERRAEEMFPGNSQLAIVKAGIWDSFGCREEALFELTKLGSEADNPVHVQLLYDSGRFVEAEKASQVLGVKINRQRAVAKQALTPPLAEFAVTRLKVPPITEAQLRKETGAIDAALAGAASPLVRRLLELEKRWLQASKGTLDSALPEWKAAGRNDMEQATALHRFAVILARHQRYDDARQVIAHAAELLPRSAVLHRMLVSLSNGDQQVVKTAHAMCPSDAELWIASIVARSRADGPGAWMRQEIETAVAQDLYGPSAIVRAGDYMLRAGQNEAAELAARYALAHGRGYLPTYGLAIKCAVAKKDLHWCLAACLGGVEQAVDPSPFYKVIVEIKSAGKSVDADLISALEFLRGKDSERSVWSERLGQVYFQKGDTQRALAVLSPMIHAGLKGARIQSLLVAAEAARLEGVPARGIEILELAYTMYADRVSVLNNLVYNLAQNPSTLPRARELLPELLEKGKDSFGVLDTVAMVYLRSGQLQEAQSYMDKALALLRKDDYAAMEVQLNAAEIALQSGDLRQARKLAQEVRKSKNISSLLDMRARAMLDRITESENTR